MLVSEWDIENFMMRSVFVSDMATAFGLKSN